MPNIEINDEMKDLASRAAWTFLQAFLGVLVLTGPAGWTVALATSAASAGIAAAISVFKTFVSQKVEGNPNPEAY